MKATCLRRPTQPLYTGSATCTRSPTKCVGATLAPHCVRCSAGVVVGVFAGALSGSLRGFKLVPAKRRCLVPPTSGYPAERVRGRPQAVGQHFAKRRKNKENE